MPSTGNRGDTSWRTARDSAPSEARKRGSGGGSPRKHDDLLSGPSDLEKGSNAGCSSSNGRGLTRISGLHKHDIEANIIGITTNDASDNYLSRYSSRLSTISQVKTTVCHNGWCRFAAPAQIASCVARCRMFVLLSRTKRQGCFSAKQVRGVGSKRNQPHIKEPK